MGKTVRSRNCEIQEKDRGEILNELGKVRQRTVEGKDDEVEK